MANKEKERKLNELCFDLSNCYKGDSYKLLRFCLHGIVAGGILNQNQVGQFLFTDLRIRGRISVVNIKILSDIANLTNNSSAKELIVEYKENSYVQQVHEGETFDAKRRGLFKMLESVSGTELKRIIGNYSSVLVHKYDNVWDAVFDLDLNLRLQTEQDMNTFLACLEPMTRKIYSDEVSPSVPSANYETQTASPEVSPVSKNEYIFISYNSTQYLLKNKIQGSLNDAKYNIRTKDSILTGDTMDILEQYIKEASIVLICFSKEYEEDLQCKQECNLVLTHKKEFIRSIVATYALDNTLFRQMSTDPQYIDFTEMGYNNQIQRLIGMIEDIRNRKNLPNLKTE